MLYHFKYESNSIVIINKRIVGRILNIPKNKLAFLIVLSDSGRIYKSTILSQSFSLNYDCSIILRLKQFSINNLKIWNIRIVNVYDHS